MNIQKALIFASIMILSACQTRLENNVMIEQNRELRAHLEAANEQIEKLQIAQATLRQEVAEKARVIDVLDTEKLSRVQESSELRGDVRRFVQHQIDAYQNFLINGGLLDYVGGELVQRAKVDSNIVFVVDLANPVPRAGTLTGVGGHFARPTTFSVKVLRRVEQNLVVIWDSKPLTVTTAGLNRINFSVSVGVEQGDIIGYYLADSSSVSFDEGTGDARYQTDEVKLGDLVRLNSLSGKKDRRAYSLGVYGLLNPAR
jgi:hypothetical protein